LLKFNKINKANVENIENNLDYFTKDYLKSIKLDQSNDYIILIKNISTINLLNQNIIFMYNEIYELIFN